jgi:hypothetical protein
MPVPSAQDQLQQEIINKMLNGILSESSLHDRYIRVQEYREFVSAMSIKQDLEKK